MQTEPPDVGTSNAPQFPSVKVTGREGAGGGIANVWGLGGLLSQQNIDQRCKTRPPPTLSQRRATTERVVLTDTTRRQPSSIRAVFRSLQR